MNLEELKSVIETSPIYRCVVENNPSIFRGKTMDMVNKIARILMLVMGISLIILGIIHFTVPKWYHDSFYPKFEYHADHIFDSEAVKTIGLWALMTGVMSIYAFIYWKKSKILIRFLAIICFAFILSQIVAFIKGYFPWLMAILFSINGILFFVSTLPADDKKN
jgi:hypothetical protein